MQMEVEKLNLKVPIDMVGMGYKLMFVGYLYIPRGKSF